MDLRLGAVHRRGVMRIEAGYFPMGKGVVRSCTVKNILDVVFTSWY